VRADRAPGAFAEFLLHVRARRCQRGDQAEEDAGPERDERRKREHSPVNGDVDDARNVVDGNAREGLHRDAGDDDPEQAARTCQEQPFDEQLPNDPQAVGAERCPHGDLAAACRRFHQRQVGDVHRANREEQRNRCTDEQHRQTRATGHRFAE